MYMSSDVSHLPLHAHMFFSSSLGTNDEKGGHAEHMRARTTPGSSRAPPRLGVNERLRGSDLPSHPFHLEPFDMERRS